MQQVEPRLLTTSRVEAQGLLLSRYSGPNPPTKPPRALASPYLGRIHAAKAERVAGEWAIEVPP